MQLCCWFAVKSNFDFWCWKKYIVSEILSKFMLLIPVLGYNPQKNRSFSCVLFDIGGLPPLPNTRFQWSIYIYLWECSGTPWSRKISKISSNKDVILKVELHILFISPTDSSILVFNFMCVIFYDPCRQFNATWSFTRFRS